MLPILHERAAIIIVTTTIIIIFLVKQREYADRKMTRFMDT